MNTANILYTWIPCKSGYFSHGRSGFKSIILHSADGYKDGDIKTLTGQTSSVVSSHWYIDRQGNIYHFVQDGDTAYHAGEVANNKYANRNSIGLEQEHRDQDNQDWPLTQVTAMAKLCAALQQKHGQMEITTHAHAAAPPGRKVDPLNYPLDMMLALMKEMLKTHWGFQAK